MSQRAKTVDHLGKIKEITHDDVLVSIISHSACSGCHAKGMCGIADSVEKTVVVHKPHHCYTVGQEVKVILKQSLGLKAMFLGYVVPFLIVFLILIILSFIHVPEGKAGLVSLSSLVPYYLGMYIFKERISKQFIFDIESF